MSKPRHPRVHVGPAWRLILQDLALDQRSVLRRAGLPPTLLDGEGSYIDLDAYYSLFHAVEAESGRPAVALQAGQVASAEPFDPAIFASLCSPDLNTAAARLGQYKRLVGAFSFEVDIGPAGTTIGYRCKHRPDLPMLLGLSELAFVTAFARRATREPLRPTRVVVQRLPDDPSPFASFFGTPLEQGPHYAVTFDAVDARRPFLTHNEPMWEAFQPELQRRMDEAAGTRSTTDSVQAALFELLPSGRAQMRDVARELGVGVRTLQRRLAAEDTSWLEILNATRERLAMHYLENTSLSPKEVSFLLGFEDPNSLFRAFHRWTGTTPEAWRARSPGRA